MGDTLKNKITTWLESEGYPLEMHVASVFQNHDFEVSQSIFLDDIEEKKPREVDVIAVKYDNPSLAFLHIAHILECKKTNKPILLFVRDNYPSGVNILHISAYINDYTRKILVNKIENFAKIFTSFRYNHCAYSITQAFTNKQDIAYNAAIKIIKSAQSHMQEDKIRCPYNHLYMAHPVIVFDSEIFICKLSKNNAAILDEVNCADLFMPISFNGAISPIIKVVSASYVDKFVEDCNDNFKKINELLDSDIKLLWENMSKH